MISINGWVCIRESFDEQNENEEKLNQIVKQVKARISKELNFPNEHYDFK